jgi:hypothetical protein
MQLLIVHGDAEVGEQLAAMVQEYTEHHCGFARSGAAALEWARRANRCSLLITQLDAEAVNGLSLGATISEMFAGLQTMFLPAYPASEQRVEVPHPKVFPEPIDGQRLLDAIAHADAQRQTGLDLYHALDVIQMCCLSRRSGALQFVRGANSAVVYLQHGDIADAECGDAGGAEALDEICGWSAIEFAYDYTMRAAARTIDMSWDEAIAGAVARRKVRALANERVAPQPAPAAPSGARRSFGFL